MGKEIKVREMGGFLTRVDLRCRHDPFTPSLWVRMTALFMPESMDKNVDKTSRKERFLT